ncbi:unnamed protein product [Clonostachys rhizophaga]|uniref:Protein-serine/threonine kinase n=1 Tax=Clonostachys rhizophaga TaxID=160324 RepID=A0A9N9VIU2_9HYPO|nr:unnamed protein product [Clonostachys rhizophaga]
MFSNVLRNSSKRTNLKTAIASATSSLSRPTVSSYLRHSGPLAASRGPSRPFTAIWRPAHILDEWVAKEARPISLRQLMVFGRSLTESRLISSANYVRTELPTRIAHRLRDMQQLPYVVVTNPHINDVYNLYYEAFDSFRNVREVKTLEDNDRLCEVISSNLKKHLTVIPKLAMGILECEGLVDAKEMDKFMNTILKSRISRRVIAEQHLSLTETYNSPNFSPGAKLSESDFIGEVFVKCNAKDAIETCAKAIHKIAKSTNPPDVKIPEIKIEGHLDTSFPYILSHLEYIIGELLRNSVQAVIDRHREHGDPNTDPPPIEVTVAEAPQHATIRISDRGGGIPREELPYLWAFSKGPLSKQRLKNLGKVPKMAATLQELHVEEELGRADLKTPPYQSSLTSLTSRPPDLRLGMGLPLSRVYAEYWAGSLELHSLEGYGVDAFLQISRLGNKNEQLATRATMDSV